MKVGYHAGSNFPERGGLPKDTRVAEVYNGWSSISFDRRSANPTRGERVESQNRNYLELTWLMEHGYREDLGGYDSYMQNHRLLDILTIHWWICSICPPLGTPGCTLERISKRQGSQPSCG